MDFDRVIDRQRGVRDNNNSRIHFELSLVIFQNFLYKRFLKLFQNRFQNEMRFYFTFLEWIIKKFHTPVLTPKTMIVIDFWNSPHVWIANGGSAVQ